MMPRKRIRQVGKRSCGLTPRVYAKPMVKTEPRFSRLRILLMTYAAEAATPDNMFYNGVRVVQVEGVPHLDREIRIRPTAHIGV